MKQVIATYFFIGYLRPAPGTWGSFFALPLFWALYQLGGPVAVIVATLVAFLGGLWATSGMVDMTGDHDPSEVVIDEVVGQWIALLPVAFGAFAMKAPILALYPGWIAAFVLFRLFDIWKPWIIGWADRRGDPLGVMLDDVFAGIFAGIVTLILAGASHGILMR